MTAGDLWKSGQRVMRLADNATLDTIKQTLQNVYFTMCHELALPVLRRRTSKTFVATDTDGLLLPSNMIGIQAVICETSGNEKKYYPTDESAKFKGDGRYHWFYRNIAVTPLVDQKSGVTIVQDATTFTGITADHTGEYIKFSSEPGMYLLSGVGTIATAYHGPQIQNKGAIIRPASTKRLCIVTPEGEYDAATVIVYYWELPTPLYNDYDEPVMPDGGRALQLKLWVDLIGPLEKRKSEADQYRAELYGADGSGGAWHELVAQCGQTIQPAIPRDRRGNVVYFGRQRRITTRGVHEGVDLGE